MTRRSERESGTPSPRARAVGIHLLGCAVGWLLAIPLLVLVALGLEASYSPSGWLMLLAGAIVVFGLLTTPWARVRRARLTRAGLALLALVVLGRVILTSSGNTTMLTLPDGVGSRW